MSFVFVVCDKLAKKGDKIQELVILRFKKYKIM